VITFDGDGGVSQTTTVSLNGMIMPNRTSLSGSYLVNPGCTGDFSLTLPGPTGPITSTSHFVIVDNGEELQTINTGEGRVLAGDAKRAAHKALVTTSLERSTCRCSERFDWSRNIVTEVKKCVLSAAGRAAIARAARKRWAKVRARAKKIAE
jgi:hypothetical protein